MSLIFAFAIYFIIWWLTLFMVLPFGVRTQGEDGAIVPGTPESAPTQFALPRVLIITTMASLVIFAVAYAIIVYRIDVQLGLPLPVPERGPAPQ
ncbi:MAG: DUF1467 family protein [Pseudomonadota bacterium]